jgi:hypothetical protein
LVSDDAAAALPWPEVLTSGTPALIAYTLSGQLITPRIRKDRPSSRLPEAAVLQNCAGFSTSHRFEPGVGLKPHQHRPGAQLLPKPRVHYATTPEHNGMEARHSDVEGVMRTSASLQDPAPRQPRHWRLDSLL